MDLRLALMCGTDIPVPECQLTIHQPKIKEIALIGEKDFLTGVQCLCMNKSMFAQDENVLANTTNFQIFMAVMSEKEAVDKKIAVQQACNLFFPTKKVVFTPRSILLNENNTSLIIDESNFEFLQKALSEICCLNSNSTSTQNFNPADKKAKEIADKLMRGRQRIAAQNGEQDVSIFSQYLSVLTVGIASMSLNDMMNLTVYQLYDLIERYSLYTNWDIDIRSRLAGAQMDSKPDNWMKNIH